MPIAPVFNQPNGPSFVDAADDKVKAIHRFSDGEWWLLRQQSNGNWVTVRSLTTDDMGAIIKSLIKGTGLRICLDLSIDP